MPDLEANEWTGSLVRSLPIDKTSPGDFSDLENFVYDRVGFPIVRPGWRPVEAGIAPGNIKHMDVFANAVSGTFLMTYTDPPVGATGGYSPTLYAWHAPGSFDAVEKAGIYRPAPALADMSSVEAGGKWYFTFNSPTDSTLRSFNGVIRHRTVGSGELAGATSVVTGAPPAARVFYANNRLWVVRPDDPSTLYGSAPDNALDWTVAANRAVVLPITPGDGGSISSIVPFGGSSFVFKDASNGGSIHQLVESLDGSGNIVFSRKTLSPSLGAVSHRAVRIIEDSDIIFGSRRGIHSLIRTDKFGDLESRFLDEEVRDRWRSLPVERKKRALMLDDWQNERIMISFDDTGSGTNSRTLYLHYNRYGPTRLVKGQQVSYPSFSEGSFGFDAGVVFTYAGTFNGTVVVGKVF